jgi:hypothetical protein
MKNGPKELFPHGMDIAAGMTRGPSAYRKEKDGT